MSAVAARRILTVPVPAADAAVPHPAGAGLAILRAGELVVHDWTGERAWAAVVDPHPGDSVRPVLHWSDAVPEIFVATGSGLSVFDPDTGRSLPVPAQLGGRPSGGAIAVSDDGRLLVVGHLDGGCSVLDLRTFQVYPVRVVDPPTGLAFSARNRDLYVSTDRVVQLWDWGRSVLLSSFGEGYRAIRGMALIPGERYLVLAEGRGVHLVRRRDGGPERFAPLPDASAIRRSASGEWILAVGSDDEGRGRVRLFGPDLAEGTDLPVASSPGGLGGGERGLFTCLDGESVQLWALPGSDPEPPPRREDARRWANRMAVTVGRTGPAALPPHNGSRRQVRGPSHPWRSPGIAWDRAGTGLFHELRPGQLVRQDDADAAPSWSVDVPATPDGWTELAPSAGTGRHLVATPAPRSGTARGPAPEVVVIDVYRAGVTARLPRGRLALPGPDHRPLEVLVSANPGAGDDLPREALLHTVGPGGARTRRLSVPEGLHRFAWSPDGARVVAGTEAGTVVWESRTWERLPSGPRDAGPVVRVAWSPDGRLLATAGAGGWNDPFARPGPVTVWDTTTWEKVAELGRIGGLTRENLAWSPDGRMLAFPSAPGGGAGGGDSAGAHTTVEIWDVARERWSGGLDPGVAGTGPVWTVAWSPAGDRISCSYANGLVTNWLTADPPATVPPPVPAPVPVAPGTALPAVPIQVRLGVDAARAGFGVPLVALLDLHALVCADPPRSPIGTLAVQPGAARLRALRWPPAAAVAIVLLLLDGLPQDARYRCPPGTSPAELERWLARALAGPRVTAHATPSLVVDLAVALDRVDDSLLTLLTVLGPELAAAEPDLPRRLRGGLEHLPVVSVPDREALAGRTLVAEDGVPGVRGAGSVGFARRGRPADLVPSQLALPEALFVARFAAGELLFRDRSGRPEPEPRGMVVVLDDTVCTHGPLGIRLRICAHLLGVRQFRTRRPGLLVPVGAQEPARPLRDRADLLHVWSCGSLAPVDLDDLDDRITRAIGALAEAGEGPPPHVVLLTHPFLPLPSAPGVRALRIAYPEPVPAPAPSLAASLSGPGRRDALLPFGATTPDLCAALSALLAEPSAATSGRPS